MPELADVRWFLIVPPLVALAAWGAWRLPVAVATLRAAALTPALARRLSGWVHAVDHDGPAFFVADGASAEVGARRAMALDRLAERFRAGTADDARARADGIRERFSDLRFADANRVPFPFARYMRDRFDLTTVVDASDGPRLRDLDGRWHLDVGGSYGVNVAGYDRYKRWIDDGWARVRALGPVLGPIHPLVGENAQRLAALSGLDEVSFHMSGTEAVMAAVRLARFNTGRRLIVTFAGAYHGWWDGVMAGLGSERPLDDCLTLTDMSPASLSVIRLRAREIAAVLVNPVQSFHPNAPPPNDAVLLTSEARTTRESSAEYGEWLRRLRAACTAANVPLIFDEVYTGFRLAPGGAQQFFGVRADMVVYGKTVGGGLPIGVVCGRRALMRRFDPARPMRLAYVVGTFAAHPAVMGAMNEFLRWVSRPEAETEYEEMNARCAAFVQASNARLAAADIPVRLVAFGTVWTVLFTAPGRYNWLLQYYLRARGVSLTWVGTGRCLTSLDFTESDYAALSDAVVGAAGDMEADGWWLRGGTPSNANTRMKVHLMKEMIRSLVPVPPSVQAFYAEVMRRKEDDHHASHNDWGNQMLHLVSSSVFLFCYGLVFADLTTATCLGLASLFVRQFGHAVLEPDAHEREETLLGYTTRQKTAIVLGYTAIPFLHLARGGAWSWAAFVASLDAIAAQWFAWTVVVVLLRVAYLIWRFDLRTSLIWYVKLVTDPITDVIAYFPRRSARA